MSGYLTSVQDRVAQVFDNVKNITTEQIITNLGEFKKQHGDKAAYLLGQDIKKAFKEGIAHTAAKKIPQHAPKSTAGTIVLFGAFCLSAPVSAAAAIAGGLLVTGVANELIDQDKITKYIDQNFKLSTKDLLLLKAQEARERVLDVVKRALGFVPKTIAREGGAIVGGIKGKQYGAEKLGKIAGANIAEQKTQRKIDRLVDEAAGLPNKAGKALTSRAKDAFKSFKRDSKTKNKMP